jgi:hypothetical protein
LSNPKGALDDEPGEDDTVHLMCSRVSNFVGLRGSERDVCSLCGEPIWVSVEGRDLQKQHKQTVLFCEECSVQQNPTAVPRVMPGTVEFLKSIFGEEYTTRIIKRATDAPLVENFPANMEDK